MRANRFERDGKSAPEVHVSRSWLKLFWSSGMSTRLSLMSLSLVWVLTMKKGVWSILHKMVRNWSRFPD